MDLRNFFHGEVVESHCWKRGDTLILPDILLSCPGNSLCL